MRRAARSTVRGGAPPIGADRAAAATAVARLARLDDRWTWRRRAPRDRSRAPAPARVDSRRFAASQKQAAGFLAAPLLQRDLAPQAPPHAPARARRATLTRPAKSPSAASGAPASRLAPAAASRRCARCAGCGVSAAARSRKAATAAKPPRAWARPAERSSSVATSSSGIDAACARCQARRSGSTSGSVACARARCTARRSACLAA